MYKLVLKIFFLLLYISVAHGQHDHSGYSGEENQEIRSLSNEEIQSYLAGHGMGFAKAAELNHYPGPKHVLELQEQLQLSPEQIKQTKQIYNEMHREAVRLGKVYVEKERAFDQALAEEEIDLLKLEEQIAEIGGLRALIRIQHLHAHLKMKQILSHAQVKAYDELRGYHLAEKQ